LNNDAVLDQQANLAIVDPFERLANLLQTFVTAPEHGRIAPSAFSGRMVPSTHSHLGKTGTAAEEAGRPIQPIRFGKLRRTLFSNQNVPSSSISTILIDKIEYRAVWSELRTGCILTRYL
jgi:hypothetical protein